MSETENKSNQGSAPASAPPVYQSNDPANTSTEWPVDGTCVFSGPNGNVLVMLDKPKCHDELSITIVAFTDDEQKYQNGHSFPTVGEREAFCDALCEAANMTATTGEFSFEPGMDRVGRHVVLSYHATKIRLNLVQEGGEGDRTHQLQFVIRHAIQRKENVQLKKTQSKMQDILDQVTTRLAELETENTRISQTRPRYVAVSKSIATKIQNRATFANDTHLSLKTLFEQEGTNHNNVFALEIVITQHNGNHPLGHNYITFEIHQRGVPQQGMSRYFQNYQYYSQLHTPITIPWYPTGEHTEITIKTKDVLIDGSYPNHGCKNWYDVTLAGIWCYE